MSQLVSVIISFLSIPVLIKLKIKLSYTLLISAGILSIISRLDFQTLGQVILSLFINPSSRATVLTVIMVSILGGLMNHYKILDKIVETLLLMVRSKKKHSNDYSSYDWSFNNTWWGLVVCTIH